MTGEKPKPILVITFSNLDRFEEMKVTLNNSPISQDYHILFIKGLNPDVKVFYEKDMIELDKEKLEELYNACIK